MKKTNVVIDLSNIVHAKHHTLLKQNKIFSNTLLFCRTVQAITFLLKRLKADGALIACDAGNYWRYDIYPEYKGNRDSLRDPYYPEVKQVIKDVADFFNIHTAIPALSVPRAEADDIIASVAQNSPHKTIIVSTDKDFIQLITEDVTLWTPTQGKYRTTEDREFELFLKCIRGDNGDNIKSAYPRIREKKLQKAWEDKFAMINIMETVNEEGKKVMDLYKFNERLIDLTRQPAYIKQAIENGINNIKLNKYNSIGVLRFIGEYNLQGVSKEFLKNKDVFNRHFIK